MKKAFHKIASAALALLVLFSSVSFTVEKHFCGSMLMDMAVFHKAESCAMELALAKKGCDSEFEKSSCCLDEQIVIEGQDELKINIEDLSFEKQWLTAVFFYTYINHFEGLDENIIPFKDYSPPELIRDHQVLYASFLI